MVVVYFDMLVLFIGLAKYLDLFNIVQNKPKDLNWNYLMFCCFGKIIVKTAINMVDYGKFYF